MDQHKQITNDLSIATLPQLQTNKNFTNSYLPFFQNKEDQICRIEKKKGKIMNCTYHIRNPISLICKAPHNCQCQRKLCVECLNEHGVDLKYIVPTKIFRKMVIKKLQDQMLDQKFEFTEQRMNFKSVLSQTESMLKKIWEEFSELSESIKRIQDMIEMENISYLNIIKDNNDLAGSSYADLEKLVKIFEGETLNNQNVQKNLYLKNLEKAKNWWDQEIQAFRKKSKEKMNEIYSLIEQDLNSQSRIQLIQQKEQVYVWKEDLLELLASLKDIDVQIYSLMIEMLQKEKISDCLGFLLKDDNQKKFQQCFFDDENLQPYDKQLKNNIKQITNVIKQIKEHDFNKTNYSTEIYREIRQDLINKISKEKKIVNFIKFLVHLTAIDNKFIQCGSNSLNLLVEMKVDLTKQCFENIKIKNTSLIGANFVKCNLSGSELENVDISGINLNRAQLFNCKWKNLRIHELHKLVGNGGGVYSVCFSSDGTTLASGNNDGSISLWDFKTGQPKSKLLGHSGWIFSVCFSTDGNTLASGSADKSIRLWDIKTRKEKSKLDGHSGGVYSVCFSPDGTTLASCSDDRSIRLWDVKTGQQKSKLDGCNGAVVSVCFSPNGNTLASSSVDKSIHLWDIETGIQKFKLLCHNGYARSLCFSPDGTTLVSGSLDKSILIWDIKTRKEKSKLDGHSGEVYSVCFSPDGTTLASSSEDRSIRQWDVKTGRQKSKLLGHGGGVYSVCFSPDGIVENNLTQTISTIKCDCV